MHSASPQCGRRSRLITYRIAPKNIYSDWLPPLPPPYFFFKLLFRSECLSDAKTATRGRFLRCSVTIKGSQTGVTARVASGCLSELSPPETQVGDLQAENRTRSDVFWNAKPYNSGFHYTVVSFPPYLPGSRHGSAVR